MCRIVAALGHSPQRLENPLLHAPRSLRVLAQEHKHGWGVATQRHALWEIARSTESAFGDSAFDQACAAESHAWIAHIRLATVGSITYENTHPFLRHNWCFAHNGTIDDRAFLQEQLSKSRDTERLGHTDSELFFAYLLSRFDTAGVIEGPADSQFDQALLQAIKEATRRVNFGAINFVLSNGHTMFIHRFGRTLWYRQAPGVLLVASEPWDSEENGWVSLSPGELLRADIERDTNSLRSLSAET